MKRLVAITFAVALLVAPSPARGDSGILIPRDKAQPDPSILSLDEMEITVRIDNGDARVYVKQIFANHTDRIEEGNYIFALPSNATVSDFAVWDGPTRIPAVVLERKRAEELYTQLKQQAIDPGLLQMGEQGPQEAGRSSVFSARIVPIPPYGTKRLELEYHEAIPVENLKSYFAIPLRPDAYQAQRARHFKINFEFHSAHAISNFQAVAKSYPLTLDEITPHDVRGHYEGENVNLTEDFVTTYDLNSSDADSLKLLTYWNPDSGQPSPTETSPVRSNDEPGFVEAEALLGFGKNQPAGGSARATGEPRVLIVLFDTSLSMQWEKLERSYRALETLLHTLRSSDRFNLLLFNNRTQTFKPSPVAADPANIQQALDFIRASRLRGGTDLQGALKAALEQCSAAGVTNTYLVLLSDGGATRGTVQNGMLESWYDANWKRLPQAQRPRNFIFAVGDDANLPLLRSLSHQDGVLEHVLSTEPLEFKLNSFLSKIGRNPIEQLRLSVAPESTVELVYPLQDSSFAGSLASWVGRYREPKENVSFSVHGVRDGAPLQMAGKTNLPRVALDHPQLPRLWARARVDALLAKIDRDGEDQASIDEIIRLARKYKFVTPYTSFLAVPRALLRPRVIRPGDPVLRVRTDKSIVSVIVLLPFGATQRLRYLAAEDIWQTRFLVPVDMDDGTYTARLLLRDRTGHTYRESKTFVIVSKTPVVRINLARKRFHRGEVVNLNVNASKTTRTLFARLEGEPAVSLRWDARAGADTGRLLVPEQLPPGVYKLTVTAEDFAHNIGTQEVQIEVLP